MTENNKKAAGKRCVVMIILSFTAAVIFALLAIWLRNSMINYNPAPNEPKEGDVVSALATTLMFGAAGISFVAGLYGLLIFFLRRCYSKKDSLN